MAPRRYPRRFAACCGYLTSQGVPLCPWYPWCRSQGSFWQLLLGDAERDRETTERRLDHAEVSRSGPQQLFLCRRQPLQPLVHKGVTDAAARYDPNGAVDDRRLQQLHDGALERAVERRVAKAEIAVGFLDAGLERGVQARAPRRVDRCRSRGDFVIAIVAARIDVQVAVRAGDAEAR